MAAFEAESQMNPGVPRLHAIFADMFVSLRQMNLVRMFTVHNLPFRSLRYVNYNSAKVRCTK